MAVAGTHRGPFFEVVSNTGDHEVTLKKALERERESIIRQVLDTLITTGKCDGLSLILLDNQRSGARGRSKAEV